MSSAATLGAHLQAWAGQDGRRQATARVVEALAGAGAAIAARIARGSIDQPMGGVMGENSDGDAQKALDLWTNTLLTEALKTAGVRAIASEEEEEPVEIDPAASLLVAFDPLDGSSNIDTNVSVGTIFSILPARDEPLFGLLQPGRLQLGAGYLIYGPQTGLMLTLGDGAMAFTFDPALGEFVLTTPSLSISPTSNEYAINAANHRHWPAPVRAYIEERQTGLRGLRGAESNMRWTGSLVADCQRILVRGGVFLYPADSRPGYGQGRLRLLYEANPIAFLVEQAGGLAIDGAERILELAPRTPHQRCPLIFGSRDEIDLILTRFSPEMESA